MVLMTLIVSSCVKDKEQKPGDVVVPDNPNTITTAQKFFLQDSLGVQTPATKITFNFKWVDSIHARSMVKLTDLNTGVVYTFQSLSYLPLIQGTLVPKNHTYNIMWTNYNNQGKSPLTHYNLYFHHLNNQVTQPLYVDTLLRSQVVSNLSFSLADSIGFYYHVTGYQ